MVYLLVLLHIEISDRFARYCNNTPFVRINTLVHHRPGLGLMAILYPSVGYSAAVTGVAQYGTVVICLFHQ